MSVPASSPAYVLAIRSPEFAFATFALGSTSAITDLMIIDISDVNNIRDIRNSRIFFKYGSVNSCSTTGCVTVCAPYYMSSDLRSIGLSQAQLLDDAQLRCTWNTMWRS